MGAQARPQTLSSPLRGPCTRPLHAAGAGRPGGPQPSQLLPKMPPGFGPRDRRHRASLANLAGLFRPRAASHRSEEAAGAGRNGQPHRASGLRPPPGTRKPPGKAAPARPHSAPSGPHLRQHVLALPGEGVVQPVEGDVMRRAQGGARGGACAVRAVPLPVAADAGERGQSRSAGARGDGRALRTPDAPAAPGSKLRPEGKESPKGGGRPGAGSAEARPHPEPQLCPAWRKVRREATGTSLGKREHAAEREVWPAPAAGAGVHPAVRLHLRPVRRHRREARASGRPPPEAARARRPQAGGARRALPRPSSGRARTGTLRASCQDGSPHPVPAQPAWGRVRCFPAVHLPKQKY